MREWRRVADTLFTSDDRRGRRLRRIAGAAALGGFAAGTRCLALWQRLLWPDLVRVTPDAGRARRSAWSKYGGATLAALPPLGLGLLWHPLFFLLVPPAFYAVEVRGLFLFPLLAEEVPDVRAEGDRRAAVWSRLGLWLGTMDLAVGMLLGGFVGRGFLASWCRGTLAVQIGSHRSAGRAAP